MFCSAIPLSVESLEATIEPKIIQQALFTAVETNYSTIANFGSSLDAQHTIGMPKKQNPANPKNPIKAFPRPLDPLVALIKFLSSTMSTSYILIA